MTGRGWVGAVGVGVAALVWGACREEERVHPEPGGLLEVHADSADAATHLPDAGVSPTDAGADAGLRDAGVLDAGAPDAGVDAGTIVLPSASGWQFFGPQHGGPREVYGVSSDATGNLWVAGGDEGLFLLAPGATSFRRFTVADGLTPYVDAAGVQPQKVLSVRGGPAHTVFVGYEGRFGGLDLNDPPDLLKSGDADKVVFNGAGITVSHFDIATPPGDPNYPTGRDLVRTIYRILYDRASGDVWFGGNHGVALWHGTYKRIQEHQHAAINGYTGTGAYTLLSGDWYGIGLDPSGDLWFGGGHRLARLQFGANRSFWGPVEPIIDVWPDAVEDDGRPDQRTDDFVQDLAVASNGAVFIGSIPNGLAVVSPGATVASFFDKRLFVDPKVTALEIDPADGSVWVGHIYGGLTRLQGGQYVHYSLDVFGEQLIEGAVPDIQSDVVGGQRRILVAFGAGAIGVYTGK